MALGDGLTTSFRSEWASTLACLVAVRAMVEGGPGVPARELAENAFDEAGRSLGRLADELTRDARSLGPPGQFVSTWKYILKKGALFQTTLTLAWLDSELLPHRHGRGRRGRAARPMCIARVQQAEDRVVAQCDLARHEVRALGPADRTVREFDCWHEEKLERPLPCAAPYGRRGAWHRRQPQSDVDDWKNCKPPTWRTRRAVSSNRRSNKSAGLRRQSDVGGNPRPVRRGRPCPSVPARTSWF